MAAGGAAGETGRETETDVATLPSRTSLSAASSSVCSLDERLLSSVSHLHCVSTSRWCSCRSLERLTGFDLHRRQWSLLNHFRTGRGHCNACHKKWGFTDSELCGCGEVQTMSHIVNSCPLTKFDGGLLHLHEADEVAVDWLTTYGS